MEQNKCGTYRERQIEKLKYFLKRFAGFIVTPLLFAFQIGRAFERWYMLMSGRFEMR